MFLALTFSIKLIKGKLLASPEQNVWERFVDVNWASPNQHQQDDAWVTFTKEARSVFCLVTAL